MYETDRHIDGEVSAMPLQLSRQKAEIGQTMTDKPTDIIKLTDIHNYIIILPEWEGGWVNTDHGSSIDSVFLDTDYMC